MLALNEAAGERARVICLASNSSLKALGMGRVAMTRQWREIVSDYLRA
jgi:hypothetical protein